MSRDQRFRVTIGGEELDVRVEVEGDRIIRVEVDGEDHNVLQVATGLLCVRSGPDMQAVTVAMEPGPRPTEAGV